MPDVVVVVVAVAVAGVPRFDVAMNGDNNIAVVSTAVIRSADVKQLLLLSLLRCVIISFPSTNTTDKKFP